MTTDSAQYRAKHPRSILAGPYGHPFHGILVTIPIGSWIASLVFDIASLVSSEAAAYARGAQLLIIIGIVGALVAAVVGLIDLAAIARGTRARRIALTHMTINLGVVVLFAIDAALRAGSDAVSPGGIALTVVALLALTVSGVLGGELAYRYGVRVADEETQRKGFETTVG